jgi:D-alanyl-lipoteichoic acid acyltransferase DltB (MBOAT superfamily)
MLFNSLHYLIFLPVVAALYYALPHRWRWLLLLAASYYFYMCWKAEYALLLLVSTAVAYYAGLGISRTEDVGRKKALLWSCLTILLGILFTFKYFNFVNASLRSVLADWKIPWELGGLNLLLPIGISFYTFQKISYVVDVYHGKVRAEKHFGIFAVYSCFFPQLVAGPIERAQHLLPQFRARHEFSHERATSGLMLILWGFFKKVAVADRLALLVKTVYGDPRSFAGLPLIVATVFFAFQIYCDFSGYTDIAIGSARLLGFDLMANFRQPYFSRSIPEFWHRWHISLSTWFRDYLYIPLGGGRVVKWRWYYNLFITFLLSGLWHGANWTFAAWGAVHGAFMVLDSIFGPGRDWLRAKLESVVAQSVFDLGNIAITFGLVAVAWIPFRAGNFSDAWYVFTHLTSGASHWLDSGALALQFRGAGLNATELIYCAVFTGLVVVYDLVDSHRNVWELLKSSPRAVRWTVGYALLILVLFFAPYNQAQNFIYFQF